MKSISAISIASFYGLMIRLLFGLSSGVMSIMSISFLCIVPIFIGFMTVKLMGLSKISSSALAFWFPWLTCLALLIITIILNIEGLICWIMIYPLFSIAAGIGGIIAYNRLQKSANRKLDITDHLNASLVYILPFLFAYIEGEKTLIKKDIVITQEVIIDASTSTVWHQLTNVNTIDYNDITPSFSTLMGFPAHKETKIKSLEIGGKRMAIYEKGLYFDETIIELIPERLLKLRIKTDPKNIPPKVMDEHIVIGGKHVDILEDIYTLLPLENGKCKLKLSSHFWIRTPFNWYSEIWAKYLMASLLKGELNLIAMRCHK
jgi:hypothetical protein